MPSDARRLACPTCGKRFTVPAGTRHPACPECSALLVPSSGGAGIPDAEIAKQIKRTADGRIRPVAAFDLGEALAGLMVLFLAGAALFFGGMLCVGVGRECGPASGYILSGILFIGLPVIYLLRSIKALLEAILQELPEKKTPGL